MTNARGPQRSEDRSVTDADREAAKRFVYDYNVRDIFQAREAPIEELTDMLARARAEGAASEREACAVECDRAAALIRTAAGMVVGNSTAAEVKRGTRTIVAFALDQVAANIRARSEGGKA